MRFAFIGTANSLRTLTLAPSSTINALIPFFMTEILSGDTPLATNCSNISFRNRHDMVKAAKNPLVERFKSP